MDSLILILLLVTIPCLIWIVFSRCIKKPATITGRATVKFHRTWLERGRKFVIGFVLSDGSVLELRTVRADYETLTDGQSGQLTWEEDLLLHFDPDITP